jgi:hypothetical protein
MHKKKGVLLTVILGVFLLLPLMAQAKRLATPIDSWTKTNNFTKNTTVALNAVTDDGAGTYVAVGNLGIALRSTDGENWDLRSPSATGNKNLLGVAYGTTIGFTGFIAVGDGKAVVKSTDGLSWQPVSQPANIVGNLKAITFGDGQWVAVGDGGGVFTYDGNIANTWTRQAITTTSPIRALSSATLNSVIFVASQHRYTAVGSGGVVLVSFDGSYWEKEVIPSGGTLQGVAFGPQPGTPGGLYVAVNSAATVFVSGDGFTSWTPHKVAATEIAAGNLRGITFAPDPLVPGSGTFVVAGNKGYIYWLDDLFGWVAGDVPTRVGTNPALRITTNIKAVGARTDGKRFYAVGESQTILTTTDITTWPYRSTSNPTARLAAAAFGNGLFVTAGQYGNIFTSPDGSRWSESRLTKFDNTFPLIESITFGNGLFVAVGDADSQDTVTPVPAIFTSPDGLTWTQRSVDTLLFGHAFIGQDLFGVASGTIGTNPGNPGWVAVGTNGTIITSTLADASLWVLQNSPTTNALNGVAFGAGNFVAVGNKGTILSSADGIQWNTVNLGTQTPNFQAVAFGNGVFVAVASNGNVYYAANPTQPWIKSNTTIAASLGVTYGAYSLGGFAGFIAVGNGGAVWESTDNGVTWAKVTTGLTLGTNLEAVAFGNDAFVAAGGSSTIITRPAVSP